MSADGRVACHHSPAELGLNIQCCGMLAATWRCICCSAPGAVYEGNGDDAVPASVLRIAHVHLGPRALPHLADDPPTLQPPPGEGCVPTSEFGNVSLKYISETGPSDGPQGPLHVVLLQMVESSYENLKKLVL
jgi:hypothetical protein